MVKYFVETINHGIIEVFELKYVLSNGKLEKSVHNLCDLYDKNDLILQGGIVLKYYIDNIDIQDIKQIWKEEWLDTS